MAAKNKYYALLLILLMGKMLIGQELKYISTFGGNPGMLKMYLHVPEKLKKVNTPALVIVLHGCTQTAKSIGAATGWNKLADSLGFVVLYPEQRMINNVSKCFNFFIGMKAKKDKGEVKSIKNMIAYTSKKYHIDSAQVFITGLSAGAGMANILLNAYPELFNAGALLGAPPTLLDGLNTTAKTVPRIIIIQGDEDKVTTQKMGEKVLDQWTEKHQLKKTPYTTTEPFKENNLMRTRSFYNANKELQIIMLNIRRTGHKILIDPGSSLQQGGRTGLHTKEIGFHSTYWIADFFGLTPP